MAEVKKCLVPFFVFLLLISLCSCGHKLVEGEVYDKEFKPSITQVVMLPIVISNGKTSSTTIVPYVYYYPDRWVIRIREPNGGGTYITDEYYTSETVYDSVNIGDTFSYDPDRDFENEPYTRERQRKE